MKISVTQGGRATRLTVSRAGLQGPAGPAGASAELTVTDSVADEAALPAAADHEDEFWLAEDTGVIWFSNGTAWIETTINAGVGTTNLSIANRGVSTLDIASSTGTDATIPAATASAAGLATAAQIAKLDGIAAGATAAGATGDAYATSHEADTSAHTAANIVNTPAGGIAATTVQAALNELDTEKAEASHTHTGVYEPVDATLLRQADVDDTPVNGVTTAPVSSNWAYDHANGTGAHAAANISVDASGFNGNLASTDDTVQKVAQKLDDLVSGGGGSGDVVDGGTLTTGLTFPVAGLHILDTNASHDLIISPGSNLTADRTLAIATGDSDRTLTLTGNASIEGTNTGDQDLSGYVTKATYDANSILAATTDNTPAAVTVAEQTLVGRITGGAIDDLSATQVRTLLNVADGATAAGATGDAFASSHSGGNQHIDWTADQGATNIHSGNIPDLSGTYAVAAKGVTNGDSHDHSGGDGAQIAYSSLSGKPVVPGSVTVILSPPGIDVAVRAGVAPFEFESDRTLGTLTVKCDPADKPAVTAIKVDLSSINASTGAATSLLTTQAEIATGAAVATGGAIATTAYTAGTRLRFDITQGSDGSGLYAVLTFA